MFDLEGVLYGCVVFSAISVGIIALQWQSKRIAKLLQKSLQTDFKKSQWV
jgi:hypothetical protein